MTEDELKALLGRPLTPTEKANRELYLDIAKENIESLLCISLSKTDDEEGRVFETNEGHRTVFTDIFRSLSEVEVNGTDATNYYTAFWDNRNNAFYNSIVFDKIPSDKKSVLIKAKWGFDPIPKDLQRLWAQAFANVAKAYKANSGNIKSKQTEDFRISYGDLSSDEVFTRDNHQTIQKYRMCNIGYIRHGKVCSHGRHCVRCI